jgi:hypothetical protein
MPVSSAPARATLGGVHNVVDITVDISGELKGYSALLEPLRKSSGSPSKPFREPYRFRPTRLLTRDRYSENRPEAQTMVVLESSAVGSSRE